MLILRIHRKVDLCEVKSVSPSYMICYRQWVEGWVLPLKRNDQFGGATAKFLLIFLLANS